jgi:hypothetical protein
MQMVSVVGMFDMLCMHRPNNNAFHLATLISRLLLSTLQSLVLEQKSFEDQNKYWRSLS